MKQKPNFIKLIMKIGKQSSAALRTLEKDTFYKISKLTTS